MKIRLLCSEVDCDQEVDPDPSDEVYAIGELQKIPRFCFSCGIKKQKQRERRERMITDILGNLLSAKINLDSTNLEGSEWRTNLNGLSDDDLGEVAVHMQELLELGKKVAVRMQELLELGKKV